MLWLGGSSSKVEEKEMEKQINRRNDKTMEELERRLWETSVKVAHLKLVKRK
jgi:hypothetical protein